MHKVCVYIYSSYNCTLISLSLYLCYLSVCHHTVTLPSHLEHVSTDTLPLCVTESSGSSSRCSAVLIHGQQLFILPLSTCNMSLPGDDECDKGEYKWLKKANSEIVPLENEDDVTDDENDEGDNGDDNEDNGDGVDNDEGRNDNLDDDKVKENGEGDEGEDSGNESEGDELSRQAVAVTMGEPVGGIAANAQVWN